MAVTDVELKNSNISPSVEFFLLRFKIQAFPSIVFFTLCLFTIVLCAEMYAVELVSECLHLCLPPLPCINGQPSEAHLHQELIRACQVEWGMIILLMEEAVRNHRSV